mmetsp:Transcript_44580/g.108065  ORF Transcript_44580/g.108065 Transcript_44580/m.108065 type:complete len:233 (-) Transcript_44580:2008-2706(-)
MSSDRCRSTAQTRLSIQVNGLWTSTTQHNRVCPSLRWYRIYTYSPLSNTMEKNCIVCVYVYVLVAAVLVLSLCTSSSNNSFAHAWERRGWMIPIKGRSVPTDNHYCHTILHQLRGGDIIHAITLEEIETVIAEHPEKLVVIDFTSKDCPPCKKVAPLYEELSESEEFLSDVVFLKVDVDENPEAVAKYQVTGWPTFIFIKQGEVQTEIVGGKLAEATLYDWVKLLMPKQKQQ